MKWLWFVGLVVYVAAFGRIYYIVKGIWETKREEMPETESMPVGERVVDGLIIAAMGLCPIVNAVIGLGLWAVADEPGRIEEILRSTLEKRKK